MAKKVAILGTVPNSRRVAPYEDTSWDIWVCSPGNSGAAAPPRITAWFELHAIVDCLSQEHKGWWEPYIAWLSAQKFPVFMQERNNYVPNALQFPRHTLLEKWGPNAKRTNWFTSTPAWMVAYALHLGVEEIGIFGIDMAATEEHYSWQKAGLLRFIEIAKEMGVNVSIPLESTLAFGFPLYGYAEASRKGRAMIVREQEIGQNIQNLTSQVNQLNAQVAFYRGAEEQVKFDRRTYVSGLEDAEIDEGFAQDSFDTISLRPPETINLSPFAETPPGKTPIPSAKDFFEMPSLGSTASTTTKSKRRSKARPRIKARPPTKKRGNGAYVET